MTNKPVWKMDDYELVHEFRRRAADANVLEALQKIQRMFDITAENKPALAAGLHVARGLIDTFAIQFGGDANVKDLKVLLTEPAPAPVAPRMHIVREPIVRAERIDGRKNKAVNENSKAGRIRAAVESIDGEITVNKIVEAVPGVTRADVGTCVMYLLQQGKLRKVGEIENGRGRNSIVYSKPAPLSEGVH